MPDTAKIRPNGKVLLLFLGIVFFIPGAGLAQDDDKGKEGRGRKEQLEKQEDKKKKAKKAREKGKEKHMEMQSKRTKKEMKTLNRRSSRWNRGRRKFFLVRWYERIRYELRKNGGP